MPRAPSPWVLRPFLTRVSRGRPVPAPRGVQGRAPVNGARTLARPGVRDAVTDRSSWVVPRSGHAAVTPPGRDHPGAWTSYRPLRFPVRVVSHPCGAIAAWSAPRGADRLTRVAADRSEQTDALHFGRSSEQ